MRSLWLLCLCVNAWAQSFEVASIKLRKDDAQQIGVAISGTRVTVSAMTLSNLIQYSRDLKMYQVTGGPAWAETDRWDIVAKASGDGVLTKAQAAKMLQSLLEERFQLKLRPVAKTVALYELRQSSAPHKLKESSPDAESYLVLTGGALTRITVSKGGLVQLADHLSHPLDRPVIDKTGLHGTYDYVLEWANGDASPSLFTAIKEQLGLELRPAKGTLDMMVIDSVQRPSEN
jgi:uncharacterized protein (TIGR03435 family)